MDELRWILLAVAVIIVAAVYFFSRARKKDSCNSPLDAANDIPSFSADEDLDNEWMDGVGPVRVVSSSEPEELDQQDIPETLITETKAEQERPEEVISDQPEEAAAEAEPEPEPVIESPVNKEPEKPAAEAIDDVVSVFVLATQDEPVIKGEKILSASYAQHLEHGEMKIFHRHAETDDREIQFSMANMLEPGWFDVGEMHQMETRGLSFFMQVNLVKNPSRALDDMLICAHSMATMLGAQLCNAQRKPLDEAYTNSLRDKVKRLAEIKAQAV